MIITIDGPSGTGKSTIAKRVAALLGFSFFDTGAMYRAVAWALVQKKIPVDDAEAIKHLLQDFRFEIHDLAGQMRYSVNEVDITEAIRTPEISAKASLVAVLPVVRKALWNIQRVFARTTNAVFEGRDMGSEVFPEAEMKFFLTARPEIRAERRYKELMSKPGVVADALTQEQVLRDLLERDERDSSRVFAPLKKAQDAKEIDTSDLNIDQIVNIILDYVKGIKKEEKSFKRRPSLLYRTVIVLVRSFFRIFYCHRIYGHEHVVPGPAILAANHTSFYDPPIVSTSVSDEVFFLARKSLFKGLFGRLIWALNARPVSGEGSDVRVFREIEALLKVGGKVILFPEGTRSADGELKPIKGGISLLVMRAHCAVIPVYIHGAKDIWGRQRKLPKFFGKTACVFGSPLYWAPYAFMEKKDAHQRFADDLRNAILALKTWYEKGAKGSPP